MICTTSNFVPGKEISNICGIVEGSVVQTKHIGNDILSGLKTLIGGRLDKYEEMMTQARNEAFEEVRKEATEMGADAIINIRYSTSAIMQGAAEVMCYGTAVNTK